MKTKVEIDLDGSAFTLDEKAFAVLRAYLDKAGERLGDHPDRTDVLAGLERSIANKLDRNRGARSTIAERELNAALVAVGRVDGPTLDDRAERRDSARPRARGRRLYRLREGQKIAGVCTGLAAFSRIDVSLIRLAFILGSMFSGGALLAAYVACAFLIPVASTPEEIAAAHNDGVAA